MHENGENCTERYTALAFETKVEIYEQPGLPIWPETQQAEQQSHTIRGLEVAAQSA